jgi:hypothetical protein
VSRKEKVRDSLAGIEKTALQSKRGPCYTFLDGERVGKKENSSNVNRRFSTAEKKFELCLLYL